MKRLRTRTNELPRILQSTTREYQPRHSKAAEAKLHLRKRTCPTLDTNASLAATGSFRNAMSGGYSPHSSHGMHHQDAASPAGGHFRLAGSRKRWRDRQLPTALGGGSGAPSDSGRWGQRRSGARAIDGSPRQKFSLARSRRERAAQSSSLVGSKGETPVIIVLIVQHAQHPS